MKSFKITENDAEQRLDKFIQKVAGNLSPSLMYKYLRKKAVKVNGKRALGNTRLKVGDLVELYINDEFFTNKNTDFRAIAYQPKLNVVYEDANLLLVDKKPGVPVHADDHAGRDTLINQVLLYLYQKGDYDPEAEHSFTPALCNRLDQNTGGLVMIAKNAAAGRALYEIVKYRQVEKRYLALALGRFSEKQATLRAYLRKDSRNNRVDICDRPREGYKEIITRYRVLRESERLSLLEIELVTGRTHQIRAHLAHIGHPVAGDLKYGTAAQNRGLPFRHQALYACSLTFKLPGDHFLSYLNGRCFQVQSVYFEKYL
ncbi:MAG: RluA family pseudouridine synthase [Clostridiales bacterium]|nr:MAG: RluA family pseudouridine synthase [Clostridiales bacterium]